MGHILFLSPKPKFERKSNLLKFPINILPPFQSFSNFIHCLQTYWREIDFIIVMGKKRNTSSVTAEFSTEDETVKPWVESVYGQRSVLGSR